jgi:hypothetical protein
VTDTVPSRLQTIKYLPKTLKSKLPIKFLVYTLFQLRIKNERYFNDNEMGGACDTYKEEYKCSQNFEGETGRKGTTLKIGE